MISNSNLKLLVSGTSSIIQSLMSSKNKSLILDPLSCIIRLGILSYKPVGTKISITKNKISFHLPTIFQGPIRWSNGDNRNDLHNLHNPIVKSLEWYSINNLLINFIFILSKNGLILLRKSYNKNSIIEQALTRYIDIMEQKLALSNVIDNEPIFRNNNNNNDDLNSISDALINLWSDSDITIVYNLLNKIDSNFENNNMTDVENYITILDQFLETKDSNVYNICLEKSTIL